MRKNYQECGEDSGIIQKQDSFVQIHFSSIYAEWYHYTKITIHERSELLPFLLPFVFLLSDAVPDVLDFVCSCQGERVAVAVYHLE